MQLSDETQSLRDRVLGFARDISIAVREAAGEEQGFLPGRGLRSGVTAVIPARGIFRATCCTRPVTSPSSRWKCVPQKSGRQPPPTRWQRSWSYAAAINIGLAATTLFHDADKAGEESLAENFSHDHCLVRRYRPFMA